MKCFTVISLTPKEYATALESAAAQGVEGGRTYDALLLAAAAALVQASGASHIDVVHGYTEPFARLLRLRGYNAHAAGTLLPMEVQV